MRLRDMIVRLLHDVRDFKLRVMNMWPEPSTEYVVSNLSRIESQIIEILENYDLLVKEAGKDGA